MSLGCPFSVSLLDITISKRGQVQRRSEEKKDPRYDSPPNAANTEPGNESFPTKTSLSCGTSDGGRS